ncbi:alkaline phosphatase family protein [Marinibaculum pumilum]|uniref:Alkaline phosphatase family protein n=1 Tax=Marinibaculum pumilum TaxID=1766165 RepID=A0ABV7L6J5_9PROT
MTARRRCVLVVCDGHRDDLVRPELCPAIAAQAVAGTRFLAHRSVFPSVTRVSAASIATGQPPAVHGLHGNSMGLPGARGIEIRDAGPPDFVGAMRAALGRTLAVPVLAQRAASLGRSIHVSNVSPGAAYFFDPDGHGSVHHRAGCYGPGLAPLAEVLPASPDAAGDRAATERFCALLRDDPSAPLVSLWLANPDKVMHGSALGSPAHRAAVAAADECVAMVAQAVAELRATGEAVLFLLGSDHGHETVRRVIPVERLLWQAGFKPERDGGDLQVAPQGGSALIYADRSVPEERLAAVAHWLRAQDWCRAVFADDDLAEVGMAPAGGLRLAVAMAGDDMPNAHGIPGRSDVAVRFETDEEVPGKGQHGGLGRYETQPFLIASGPGFGAGETRSAATSLLDIAPTVLRHLGLPQDGLPGRPLQS